MAIDNPNPSNPPTLSSLLRQLHETLHSQWLTDFLFTSEPIHLPYFSSPPVSPLLCQIHTSRVAQPLPDTTDPTSETTPLSTLLNARFLLIPAFTAADVTLGFGVIDGHDIRYNPSATAHPTFGPQDIAFRKSVRFFKHSAGQKLFVMLLDEPAADAFIISACWHDDATVSTSLAAKLNRTPFLDALRADDGCLRLSHLEQHVRSVSQQRLYRACPHCGRRESCICPTDSSPAANVADDPTAGRPKHAFDFAHFERVISDEFGVFEGSGVRIAANADGADKMMSFAVTSCMQAMRDEEGMRDLRGWGGRRSFCVARESTAEDEERKSGVWGEGDEGMKYLQMKDGEEVSGGGTAGGLGGCTSVMVEATSRGSIGQGDVVDKVELEGMEEFTGDEFLLSESMVQGREEDTKEGFKGTETETSHVPIIQSVKGEEEVVTKEVMEKRQRMLQRKERNRLAAQRSNMRKKMERDAMKQELSALHEKEEHLREREATLRKENLLLKELVTERDGS